MNENEKKKEIASIDITANANNPEERAIIREALAVAKEREQDFSSNHNPSNQPMTDEEKLALAEVEKINFEDVKAEFAEKTGDSSIKEIKTKEELKNKLDKLLTLGAQQANKHETPAGSPLVPQQWGQQGITDLRKLPVNANTIMYLNNLRRNGSSEASQILDELWIKSISSWRNSGHQPIEYSPDDNIQKNNSVPDLNFDSLKTNGEESGFPQIKKSPYGYSRTHTPSGQKKEGS